MNIKDISKPITANTLNESLARKFGQKLNLAKFSTTQLEDVRNKLRTKLSQVETNEGYNSVQSEDYAKDKMFLDVINAEIAERAEHIIEEPVAESVVTEGAEDEAELVMAARDMVDRVTGWLEDTAEMQTESMLDLADAIRDELGSESSEAFVSTVKPALEQLYTAMESTRQALTSGVGQLTGDETATEPMGADDEMGDDDMSADAEMEPIDDTEGNMDLDTDDFEADAAAAGGEEPAGREKRESVNRSKKKYLKR